MQKIGDKTYKYLKSVFDVYGTNDCKIAGIENIQFQAQKTGYIWINKKLLFDHYKDELSKYAKTLQDFKDCLFWYFDDKEIEFKAQKAGGNGGTVEHFRFLQLGATITENTLQLDTETETDLPF